jgi:thymidine kinase
MFSGKSEATLREVRRQVVARRRVVVYRPTIDARHGDAEVHTYDGTTFPAIVVRTSSEIPALARRARADAVAVEEAQFFDSGIVDVVRGLADRGVVVIVNGLSQDAFGEPFGPMPALLACADEISCLTAICNTCGEPATKSQRLGPDGRPVPRRGAPTIEVGGHGDDKYEARCRAHHVVP